MNHFVVNEIKMIVPGCPQGSLKELDFQSRHLSKRKLGSYQSPGDLITACGAKAVDGLELTLAFRLGHQDAKIASTHRTDSGQRFDHSMILTPQD
jgi:hypothetical protein